MFARHCTSYSRMGLDFSPSFSRVSQIKQVLLGQVLNMLIANALKVTNIMKPGYFVMVGVERVAPGDTEDADGILAPPGYTRLKFYVGDCGHGVPEHHQELIFREDGNTDGRTMQRHGPGLGLPLIKGLVALMGGELKVTSPWPRAVMETKVTSPMAYAKGTLMHFTLALKEAPPAKEDGEEEEEGDDEEEEESGDSGDDDDTQEKDGEADAKNAATPGNKSPSEGPAK